MTNKAPPPVWTGQNILAKFLINNQPQDAAATLIKSMKISQKATIFEDNYIGQKRTRFDKQIDSYEVEIDSDMANMKLADLLLDRDTKRENNQAYPEIGITWSAVDRATGEVSGYFLTGIEGSWDIGFEGRKERVKFAQKYSASDFKPSA